MALTIAYTMPRNKYGQPSISERLQNIRKARGLGKAIRATADELLLATPPERYQKAVVRLIQSLLTATAIHKNGVEGVRNGR